jgi:signal recognition particle subunit SRP14
MVLLQPDPFLTELTRMFERTKEKGSLTVCMKRTAMKPRRSKKPEPPPEEAYKCLVRASDGKRTISTTINAGQHAKFCGSLTVIQKARMDALRAAVKKGKAPGSKLKAQQLQLGGK